MAHVVPCETIQSCIEALELIYLDVPVTPTTTSPLLRLAREIKQLRALLNKPSELVLEIERVRRQTIKECAKVCEQQMTGANELMDTTREMDARAIRKLLVD